MQEQHHPLNLLHAAQVQGCDGRGRLRSEGYGWITLSTSDIGVHTHSVNTWRPVQPHASSQLRSVFQGDPAREWQMKLAAGIVSAWH